MGEVYNTKKKDPQNYGVVYYYYYYWFVCMCARMHTHVHASVHM